MDFFHLCGRGVEKRAIVMDDSDRLRFIHDLYVFNDTHPTPNYILPGRHDGSTTRQKLLDIHAFCLMDNHYHLLVSERIEGGVSLFMKKLNMGYAKYFNERHGRSGSLWQGKYRKIQIKRDAHFLYIPFYIHLNPLDYSVPGWRQGKAKNKQYALKALEAYRWSSYLDYAGKRNFPSILRMDVLGKMLGPEREQEKTIANIIHDPNLAMESNDIEYKN